MEELRPHPLCEAFPPIPAPELRELANDIAANGLRYPIVTYDGMILDGWHRYQCCLTENVEPVCIDYEGDDPVSFVRSMNMHRRHLTRADQKKIAKEILKFEPERSDRSIARDTGLHHSTVADIRAEAEEEAAPARNGETSHYEHAGQTVLSDGLAIDDPGGPLDPSLTPGGLESRPAAKLPRARPRIESTGKKARGRKPSGLTAKERKAVKENAAAEKKAGKPKPLTNDRDAWVAATTAHIKADPGEALQSIVLIVDGYFLLVQSKLSEVKRRDLLERFGKALGLRASGAPALGAREMERADEPF